MTLTVGGGTGVSVGGTVGGTRVKVGRGGVRVTVRVAVACAPAIRSPVRQPSKINQTIPPRRRGKREGPCFDKAGLYGRMKDEEQEQYSVFSVQWLD